MWGRLLSFTIVIVLFLALAFGILYLILKEMSSKKVTQIATPNPAVKSLTLTSGF